VKLKHKISHSFSIRAFLLGFVLLVVPSLQAEDTLDIEYAELQPLSTRSLLLDIAALQGGGYVAVGERGHVVLSDDGNSWKQSKVVPTRSTLTTVAQAGGRLWAGGHDTVILTSGDGGNTWTRQFYDEERQQAIMDLYFLDSQHGWAIGAYGLALVTSDGGAHWEEGVINEEEWHNNAMMGDENLLLVAGEAGFSYRSLDNGETWETIEMPYAGSMFGIIPAAGNCVMVFGLRGNVQRSCDDGETWEEQETPTLSSITGAVYDQGRTVMVGNSGLILTQDSDGAFRAQNHSSGMDFAAIVAMGGGKYLLAGEDGIHHFPEQTAEKP
jgi:photosystem II stability/assembly factor-like uncharacterized protein